MIQINQVYQNEQDIFRYMNDVDEVLNQKLALVECLKEKFSRFREFVN